MHPVFADTELNTVETYTYAYDTVYTITTGFPLRAIIPDRAQFMN